MVGLSFSTFAVANLALAPLGGRLADRGEYPRWLLVGFLGLATVMAGYGLAPGAPTILVLGLCEGAVAAIAFPTLDAYLAAKADPRIQGRIQGAFSSSMMAGAASSARNARSQPGSTHPSKLTKASSRPRAALAPLLQPAQKPTFSSIRSDRAAAQ